jgi:hypothetical protein
VIQNGYFTNSSGAVWGVCTEICPVCNAAPETTAHLFFECAEVKQRWIRVIRLLRSSNMAFESVDMAFAIIKKAVTSHQKNPALMVLVGEMTWSAWVERNASVFQGNSTRMPIQVIFRNCASKLEAMAGTVENKRRLAVLNASRDLFSKVAQNMSSRDGAL